ncbi:MAG: hypothetical protein KDK40_04745 [Chlamydiia bacterium]|nr:hypothetical protein [Chlamydiia bacterium]
METESVKLCLSHHIIEDYLGHKVEAQKSSDVCLKAIELLKNEILRLRAEQKLEFSKECKEELESLNQKNPSLAHWTEQLINGETPKNDREVSELLEDLDTNWHVLEDDGLPAPDNVNPGKCQVLWGELKEAVSLCRAHAEERQESHSKIASVALTLLTAMPYLSTALQIGKVVRILIV